MATNKRLIVVTGPTASGKTCRAIQLAQQYHTEIVSCDSRQFYVELNIGVARPSPAELDAVPHHFIACRSVSNPYNVFDFESDAISLLNGLFKRYDVVVAVGGSGLYIEALCKGIAVLPDPPAALRASLQERLAVEGIASLQEQLRQLDPDYYDRVDRCNPARLQRALEVCLTAGRPYSELLKQQELKKRPFEIDVEVVCREPGELRSRIDARVEQMVADGLCDEVQSVWNLRHFNTLNTVGYREFFAYGSMKDAMSHLDEIVGSIKLNTWHYAKKQMTWCRKKYGQG
ncbi:MAG: tRNA (adenosine(37)-N6)-dimethylallyltransferase MiaA [Bacteroidales bacterium]|nr:tRNA (adenosine(37)-N6)-dimethylallyltransferase MiaA [Bacteroidales bacterium]